MLGIIGLLKVGQAGLQVLELINGLKKAGFEPDGDLGSVFTKGVKEAVMAFQSQNNRPQPAAARR